MSAVPALDALGRELGGALRRELPSLRRRRRASLAGAVLTAAVAVPAAGTATDWAGLAGGETPLPTQVDPGLRATLLEARDARGRYRLEAYRAEIGPRGGTVGVCLFVSRSRGGAGRCVAPDELGQLLVVGDAGLAGATGGVVRGAVARVEVTVRTFDRARRRRVLAVRPAPAPVEALRARGLPEDLRPFAVSGPYEVLAVRALDARGATVERIVP